MSITTCAVTGTIQDSLGNPVIGATVSVYAPTPFWHDSGILISGTLDTTTTSSSGAWTLNCIETASCNQSLTFLFTYYDGSSGQRRKTYSVVVPNQTTVTLYSLIGTTQGQSAPIPLGVQYGGTGLATLPSNAVLLGAGVGTLQSALPVTAGYVLTDNGTGINPSFQAPSVTVVTGVLPVLNGGTGVTTSTGSGSNVLNTSPTLVTPALGTPSALVGTNITGTAAGLTAGTVTTNANLTGPIASSGNATSITAQTGTGTTFVMSVSPTLTTPNLGTPSALVGTNITGTATAFTATSVTTNANLTGVITSVGNATSIASQTGTGTTFAMSAGPTFTGTLAAAVGTFSGTLGVTGVLTGSNTTDASSTTVAGTIVSGGLAVAKKAYVGGDLVVGGTGSSVPGLTKIDATGTATVSLPGAAYTFTVVAANATAGATYTNNGQTFTVVSTIAGGLTLLGSATGAPAASGTLTKATGIGDATITFTASATTTTNGGTQSFNLGAGGADGLILLENTSSGKTALMMTTGGLGAVTVVSDPGSNWSTSSNTASKDCVTISSTSIVIQHNAANSSAGFRVVQIRAG